MLDLKDRKLLFALDFNARATYAELGRQIRLSKQGTEYKLKSLVKRGIIKGFYPVLNIPKLGYKYCRLLMTLQNITREKHHEIIAHLRSHQKVFWLFQMQGPYDLLIVIWAKQVAEFKEFVEELESKYGHHIKRKRETLATDVIHLQHRHLVDAKRLEEIHIKETEEQLGIDGTDERILKALCEDARMQLVEIARRVKQSPKVVAYRIRRMEQQGLIEAYRPIIDHNRLGLTYYKIFISLNNANKEQRARIIAYIKEQPIVIYWVEGIGLPADLDIELMVASNQQLFSFIEELRFRFLAIGEYETVIFMDTLKVRYTPF